MKFNMQLTSDDIIIQKEYLEELYSSTTNGVRVVDTASVHKCLQILENTFSSTEICPKCGKGTMRLVNNSQSCSVCHYIVKLSTKTS